MEFGSTSVYTYELWAPNGARLADITPFCQDRQITLQRNEAEQFTFTLDLAVWEDFCASRNKDPVDLLDCYWTELRIKRNGQYWKGGQVVAKPYNISAADPTVSQEGSLGSSTIRDTLQVVATGYLNLFRDRYVTVDYSAVDAAVISSNLLTLTQTQTNGSVGVSIGVGNQTADKLRDRSYIRQDVKAGIQNLAALTDAPFDFEFTHDKQYLTYKQIGSKRTDLHFVIGGDRSNITSFYMEETAASLYNRIIALGSGFGIDQLVSTADDNVSQLKRFLREDIRQFNSVIDQSTLDEHAASELATSKDLLAIPQITITGNELANVPFLNIGDRVPISSPYKSLSHLIGYYRIEKMVINLDDNDFEASITLYFDNFMVSDV